MKIIIKLITIIFVSINISHARYDFGFSNEINANNMVNSHINEENANNNAYYDDYKENPPSYDVNNIESNARDVEYNDQNSQLLKESYETNNLEFRGDESFLATSRDIVINNKSSVNLEYSSCKDLEFNCFDYKKSINKSCISDLINKDYGNHLFTCKEQKNISSNFCLEKNQFSCKKSIYTLPDTTYMTFPHYYFRNNRLGYITPNRMYQNCGGYNYYWRFNLNSLDNMEELKFIWGQADDRTLIYINSHLVHNYPNRGCELWRTFYNAPNKDLKPYLKIGNNEIRVRIIVGGRGEARGEFRVKYKKCQEFNKVTSNNCGSLESNQNCNKQGAKFCSKTDNNYYILGKKVNECLEYKTSYNCVDEEFNHDKCDSFKSDTKCAIHSDICNNYNQEFNKCISRTSKFECDYKKEFDNYDNIDYEFTYDVNLLNYDESNCQNYKSDPNSCTLSNKKCLLFDQNNICHKYQNNYQCGNNPNSKCNILSNECNFLRSKCHEFDNQNACLIEHKHYFCPNKVDNIGGNNDDILMCDMSDYISNNEDPEAENDFGNAISNMKMLEEAGDDFINDPLSIFTGQANSCNQDKLSYNNCCKAGGWGDDIGLGGCSYNEEKLQLQSKNKQCIYVGAHCSKKILGKCVKNKHSYCCFNSKIAKLIQEQGKPQIGKSFGNSNSPNCSGLTQSDISNIDFSKMDFSQITADIISTTNPHNSQEFNNLAKEKIEEFFDKHQNQ
ncbi:conjugal transfer protein TraN [Rickettsiales bacterium]|nr:conjugal transfer protein TraN [Rickettsiales bacterium]